MNPSIPENKTKLRLNKEELLAKLAAGPASVNSGEKSSRNAAAINIGITIGT